MDVMSNPQDDVRPPRKGATAISAGVLALLGAVFWGFATLRGVYSLYHRSDPERIVDHHNGQISIYPSGIWIGWIPLTEAVLATVLLLSGGILLLTHKQVGRWAILVGCVAAVANEFHPLFATAYWYDSYSNWDLLPVLFAVLTATLALAPTTKRWCRLS
jgi:hypothetical protein